MDLEISRISNEAELESLFVIPLLENLGISRADIRMQETLRFQAGRHTLEEKVSDALREKRARLDIRVTLNDRNFFIIEAKRRGAQLTEDDALQAISYARLVHPMAPYALVTNGDETKVYDTVSRDQISPENINLEGGFDITLPGSDDFDALVCFLRLSKRNLLLFAHAQVTERMRSLRGSRTDLAKKYIPEVHQPRAAVRTALGKFRSSSKAVLALVAESGMGKTCTMCHEILTSLDAESPVLFFRGSELRSSFLGEIADEFAWTFTEETSPQALVKRLSNIVGAEKLLIFLDAVDEWGDRTSVQQLGSLARQLSDTNIKLVISCKNSTWPSLLQFRDSPTDLANYVEHHPHGEGASGPGLLVGALDESEFSQVWARYEEVYGFRGVWDPKLREEARRSLFFMRIAFEVAREEGLREIRDSRREIFEHYYAASIRKTTDPELAGRLLAVLADALLEANEDRLTIEDFRQQLQLRPTEELPWELVEYGVLEQVGGPLGNAANIRFAFEGLRNYVIAFKARRWYTLDERELEEEYRRLDREGVQEEAWNAFYKLATSQQMRVIDRKLYEPAMRFLRAYREVIGTHFRAFRQAFPPGDPNRAGLVFAANLRRKEPFNYGVRHLTDDETEILILPAASASLSWDNLLRFGAGDLMNRIGPGLNWLEMDPWEELLRVNFSRLLPQAVHQGELGETEAPDLARELLAAAVLSKPELVNEPNRGAGKEGLPLRAKRIEYWLLLNQHWKREESELINKKIRRGIIPTWPEGSGRSYSMPPLSTEERTELRKRCDRLISAGVRTFGPGRYLPLDNIADRLRRAVAELPDQEEVIQGPLFPEAADGRRLAGLIERPTSEIMDYAGRFVASFLRNYGGLIRSNFPTLKEYFALYRELPVFGRVTLLGANGIRLRDATLALDFFSSEPPGIEGIMVESIQLSERRDWDVKRRDPIEVEGRSLTWRSGFWTGARCLWGGSKQHPSLGLNASYTVLRDFTYWWIERELAEVGKALGKLYGVDGLELRPF
jgi:hypothetical protein